MCQSNISRYFRCRYILDVRLGYWWTTLLRQLRRLLSFWSQNLDTILPIHLRHRSNDVLFAKVSTRQRAWRNDADFQLAIFPSSYSLYHSPCHPSTCQYCLVWHIISIDPAYTARFCWLFYLRHRVIGRIVVWSTSVMFRGKKVAVDILHGSYHAFRRWARDQSMRVRA